MHSIAQVAILSPLPQLDRLFDYSVPAELEPLIGLGVRVKVPFGRSKTAYDGFVVGFAEASEYSGTLSPIAEVVSLANVLDQNIFQTARAVANRQAATVSDVLRLAVPDRSVAVEKKWLDSKAATPADSKLGTARRTASLVRPVTTQAGPEWVARIMRMIEHAIQVGGSTIVVLPDYRDQSLVLDAMSKSQHADLLVDYSTNQTKSARYASFLRCISSPISVVIGSRASVYAPVNSLKQIIIWDDGDHSHYEQMSPYSHTREVALIRQQVQSCDVHILGHSRSTEAARYIGLKFFEDDSQNFPMPKVANSDSDIRVDSLAWRAIRSGLETGAVLVQVSSKGTSVSAYCAECDTRASCRSCNGPLWLDSKNLTRCRWCNSINMDHRCSLCQSSKLKQSRAGSSRTASEFGKAFPGARIIEATGDAPVLKVLKNSLVVATPGAEPFVEGGYSAVVILDANSALGKDTLRATEDAVRCWSNAIALMNADGQAVVVGLRGSLAQKFSLWSLDDIANFELSTRVELRFPPALRLASLGAEDRLLSEITTELASIEGVEVLGPIPIVEKGIAIESRVLIKYEYGMGSSLSNLLRTLTLKYSAGNQRTSVKSGRAMRPIRVKMDDHEVI